MRNGKLIRNYLYNTIYQILVLIAPLITTPYVSRVLGVTNLGIYNYSQSIATYFILIGAVGTSLYGQREIAYCQDDINKRTQTFWEIELFRIFGVVLCSLIYGITFIGFGRYTEVYGILLFEILAAAFDISWFFMGLEDFKLTVIRNTIIKLTGVICVFIFVKTSDDLLIYTVCMTVPVLIGNLSLWFALRKNLVKVKFKFIPFRQGIYNRLHAIFALFLPQIAMEVYTVLDKTMIGIIASDIDQVGYYSQAQKVVKLILAIVTSLGTVMLPAMSAYYAKGDHEGIIKSIKSAFRFIYMLSFALMFGICAIASKFVPVFFGDGYDLVISLIIIISPILVIIATSNVLGRQYLIPTNQQKPFTISIVIGAVVNFVFNIILINILDAIGASIATVLGELTVAGVQCWFVRKQLPLKDCLTPMIRYLILGGIMFVITRFIGHLMIGPNIIVLLVMIFVGVIVYLLELLLTKDPMLYMGISAIKKKKC